MPIPEKKNQLNRVSARQYVYNELKSWIIDGTMLPGEFINDSEIAKHFQVSRTPVREAILMLAGQDFVKIIPSKGTQITPVGPQHAAAIYEAIACLSKEIAVLAVAKHTAGDILQLKKLNDKFNICVEGGDHKEILAADQAFHDYILKIADNRYISNCWHDLIPHSYRYEMLYFKEGVNKKPSVVQHRDIIKAIENKDSRQAARCCAKNWTDLYELRLKPKLINEKDISDFLLYHKYY